MELLTDCSANSSWCLPKSMKERANAVHSNCVGILQGRHKSPIGLPLHCQGVVDEDGAGVFYQCTCSACADSASLLQPAWRMTIPCYVCSWIWSAVRGRSVSAPVASFINIAVGSTDIFCCSHLRLSYQTWQWTLFISTIFCSGVKVLGWSLFLCLPICCALQCAVCSRTLNRAVVSRLISSRACLRFRKELSLCSFFIFSLLLWSCAIGKHRWWLLRAWLHGWMCWHNNWGSWAWLINWDQGLWTKSFFRRIGAVLRAIICLLVAMNLLTVSRWAVSSKAVWSCALGWGLPQ